MLLGFIGRVILVRFTTQTEYGIYCLALVIISIFVTISTLGLSDDSTRYIAYFRGKNEEGKVRGVIASSLKIAIIASITTVFIAIFRGFNMVDEVHFHGSFIFIYAMLRLGGVSDVHNRVKG